jgi:hypothetical protein
MVAPIVAPAAGSLVSAALDVGENLLKKKLEKGAEYLADRI